MREQYRLYKLSKKIDNGYPPAVYFSEKKQRYIRLYRGSRSSHLKGRNNRKVRRTEDIPNGNGYRKVAEFWWEYC